MSAKLVIIMVGLPARGKSYITKKITRYMRWQQHNTKIFNVGSRRRVAAGQPSSGSPKEANNPTGVDERLQAATVLLNGVAAPGSDEPTELDLNNDPASGKTVQDPHNNQSSPGNDKDHDVNKIDQSAKFFDPKNSTARALREKVAMDTLNELLDYLVSDRGAVGILDATNSTIHRRDLLVQKIREREPKLGILFIESICHDKSVSHLPASVSGGEDLETDTAAAPRGQHAPEALRSRLQRQGPG